MFTLILQSTLLWDAVLGGTFISMELRGNSMKIFTVQVVLALLLVAPVMAYDLSEIDGDDSHGDAFVIKGWELSELPLKWAVPKDNVPETTITTTDWYNVVQASFQSWENVVTSIVDFEPDNQYGNAQGIYELTNDQDPATYDSIRTETTYTGSSGTVLRGVPPTYDGKLNMVVCVTQNAQWPNFGFSGGALAVTVYAYNPTTRYIVGGDIYMNADNYTWEIGNATPGTFDLQNTLTHEVGHFIGMGHPMSADKTASTMYASAPSGETDKRSLEVDDMNGATYLYPAPGATLVPPDNNLMGLRDLTTGEWTDSTGTPRTVSDGTSGGGGGCTMTKRPELGGSFNMSVGFLLSFLPLIIVSLFGKELRKRRKVVGAALLLIILLLPSYANATIVIRMNIMEMTLMSKRVVHGQITNISQSRAGAMVFTDVEVTVIEPLKGSEETKANFRLPGGVIDDYGVHVPGTPTFKLNEEVIVFLEGKEANIVCGMAQGKFAIERTKDGEASAIQDTRGLCLLDARGPSKNEEGGPATAWAEPIEAKSALTGTQVKQGRFIRGNLLKVPLSTLKETIKSFDPGK